jgi:formylglycine-generating enzyme required for sulfatase activity
MNRLITFIVVIGFSMVACSDGDDPVDGKKGVAPAITTATTMPGGTVGTAYNQTLAATGDTPITWSLDGGTLPTGINLFGSGVISGTPTVANTYTFTVKATNVAGNDTKQLTITIEPSGGGGTAPTITTVSPLPGGTVGTAYSQTLLATGTAPITWSLDSGDLPTGLDIVGSAIAGTPSAANTFTFIVKATNSAGSVTKPLSITISGGGTAPTTTTVSPLPGGTVGTAYSQTLLATGTAPITWSLDSGDLPTGLNVYGSGVITGMPTVARTSTFTVKAANAAGSVTKQLSITITGDGGGQTSIEMVQIQGGTFTMGSPVGEPGRWAEETQHEVTLTGFRMGKYLVTQAQYYALMGTNPSYFHGGVGREPADGELQASRPVEHLSWYSVLVFCNKLSETDGLTPAYRINGSTDPADWGNVPTAENSPNKATWDAVQIVSDSNGYRLPTEAQWEYACRADTTTAYNTGDTISDDTGWYNSNSNQKTHSVGKKPANAWGLYDTHGNVWEFCWDWYGENYYTVSPNQDPMGPVSGSRRVLRSGVYYSESAHLRSAFRADCGAIDSINTFGFRLVLP